MKLRSFALWLVCTLCVHSRPALAVPVDPDAEDTIGEGSVHWKALHGGIEEPEPVLGAPRQRTAASARTQKTGMVYGYLRAGQTAASVARWDLMTQVVWFGVTMSPTGTVAAFAGLGDSKYQGILQAAHENDVELLIGALLFNTADDPNKVANFINNKATAIPVLVNLMLEHDADGISLDLEVVPESHKQAYVDLLADLSAAVKAARPGAHVSSAIPPPTGWKGYDYPGILANSDSAFVMVYDYYWVTGPYAGPVTPKNDKTLWGTLNYTQSLNKFVSTLTPAELQKLVIGLPWYGYDWPTVDSSLRAKVDKSRTSKARSFATGRSFIEDSTTGFYDALSEQPYAVYQDGGTRQLWLDNAASFGAKTQMIVDRAMGGVGLFALAYEGGDTGMWGEIETRYADHAPTAAIAVASSGDAGDTLRATAEGSADTDGDALAYAWSCTNCTVLSPSSPVTDIQLGAEGSATLSVTVTARTLSDSANAVIAITKGDGSTSGSTTGGSSGGTTGSTSGGTTGGTSGGTTGSTGSVGTTTGSDGKINISGTRAAGLGETKQGCAATGSGFAAGWAVLLVLWLKKRGS